MLLNAGRVIFFGVEDTFCIGFHSALSIGFFLPKF